MYTWLKNIYKIEDRKLVFFPSTINVYPAKTPPPFLQAGTAPLAAIGGFGGVLLKK
jgi:hypothetical protein